MRRRAARRIALGGLFLAAACGQGAGNRAPAPASGVDTTVTGTVVEVGSVPLTQVVLRAPDGSQVAVRGGPRPEIASLVGAEVRVTGRAIPNPAPPPARAVEASAYEVVSVAGERPVVGWLEQRTDGLWLVADRAWRLRDVPADMQAYAGRKAWVVGDVTDDRLSVRLYGIIATEETRGP